ncbi:ATP-binding protein [Anabaena sp. UHCC 0187]|uniref:NB-ARC domain-containing protein n=1 Tax=Anabaena sp. UHCC 0187 TaxID=2590018 RepID=UPI0014469E87|nr:NB-ARC domain-containing protein [Anabaena sp. UHCC 0187]MTJ11203.1 ATP-binding protein [Anabaena sp. UHCC 0187]
MDVGEILNFADHVVFTQTGKHLNNLQKEVLERVWQDQDYSTIAETVHKDEQYIRNIASELWQVLSKGLHEKVNKSNLKTAIERQIIISSNKNITNFNFVGVGNLHVCPEHNPSIPPIHETNTNEFKKDLITAPIITEFYGRNFELQTLENYIIKSKARLINLYGITGIGKSTLAKRFIDIYDSEFEVIIWRNLQLKPHVDEVINSILLFLNPQGYFSEKLEKNFDKLLKVLDEKRCLIVIDGLQYLFDSGKLAGEYQPEYQSYQTLFNTIIDIPHKSCLLLISQQKTKEVTQLEKDNNLVYSLQLKGSDEAGIEIFKSKGLQDEDKWLNLINLYQSNPRWLKWVANLTQELANGRVTEIFTDDSILLIEEVKDCLDQIFLRLLDSEKEILLALAKLDTSVSIIQLKELVSLSQIELVNGMRSLLRRCLIETIEKPQVVYSLNPLLRVYCLNLSGY